MDGARKLTAVVSLVLAVYPWEGSFSDTGGNSPDHKRSSGRTQEKDGTMTGKLLSTAAVAALSAGLWAGPVGTDPSTPEQRHRAADLRQRPDVRRRGQRWGEFTPGHVVGGNAIFVPVAFGEITATALPSGTTAMVEPSSTKGKSGKNKDLTTCSFEFTVPVGP